MCVLSRKIMVVEFCSSSTSGTNGAHAQLDNGGFGIDRVLCCNITNNTKMFRACALLNTLFRVQCVCVLYKHILFLSTCS